MACAFRRNPGVLKSSDALPANELGFRKSKKPACVALSNSSVRACVDAPPACVCGSCRIVNSNALVAGFEDGTLAGFVANNTVDGTVVTHNVRVIDAVTLKGQTYCTGAALSSSLWNQQGFLSVPGGTTYALRSANTLGTNALTQPYAMCAIPDRSALAIVGTGESMSADGTSTTLNLPSVAYVTVSISGDVDIVVYTFAGLNQELFTGVCIDSDPVGPCCPTLYVDVCGTYLNTISNSNMATFRRLEIDNAFAPVVLENGDTYTSVAYALKNAFGTSIASSSTLGFVVITVLVSDGQTRTNTAQTAVWTLQYNGTPVPSITGNVQLTGFNDPASGLLRQVNSDTVGTVGVKVLISTQGAGHIYVVAQGLSSTSSVSLPATTVVVYAFSTDTNPDTAFGALGISQWYAAGGFGSAFPQAASLDAQGAILVTGDCFASEKAAGLTDAFIYDYAAWWRNAIVPQDGAAISTPPTPFVVRLNGQSGLVCPLLVGVPGCPSSPLVYTSALVVTPLHGIELLGDWSTNPTGLAQPAGLVDIIMRGPAVQNCTYVPTPVIQTACDGVVSVDARCCVLPTVLSVNGPIVVGYTSSLSCLPGAIRFDPATKTFEGFDGTSWIALS